MIKLNMGSKDYSVVVRKSHPQGLGKPLATRHGVKVGSTTRRVWYTSLGAVGDLYVVDPSGI
jgi:hypothetical protein